MDIQVGDRITSENKNTGKMYVEIAYNEFIVENIEKCAYLDIKKIERPTYTTIYKKKEEILGEVEKEYLRNVIRPFKYRVISISKKQGGNLYFISISLAPSEVFSSEDVINLPFFKNKEMYAGMKSDKNYTLKELGLE